MMVVATMMMMMTMMMLVVMVMVVAVMMCFLYAENFPMSKNTKQNIKKKST